MLPAVPILLLLGIGAVAVSKKHAGVHSVTLDANMPPLLVQQTLGLLSTSKDPAELTAHALQLQINYPLASQALLSKAATLPHPSSSTVAPAPSTQAPGVPPTALPALDPGIDKLTAQAVVTALTVETDPAALIGFASAIQNKYPAAAGALTVKAAALTAAQHAANAAEQPLAPAAQSAPTAVTTSTSSSGAAAGAVPLLILGVGAIAALMFSKKKAMAATTSPSGAPNIAPGATPGPLATPDTSLVAAVPASPVSTPAPTQAPAPLPSDMGTATAPPADTPDPTRLTAASSTPATAPGANPATAAGTWIIATDADVSRDGTASVYASMIAKNVGDDATGTYNGRTWKFRVVSASSDPSLTAYSKDVKGWIWQPAGGAPMGQAATASPPVLVPVVTSHVLASVPPSSTIRTLQHKLNQLQIVSPPLAEDGVNGPKTIAATKTFQSTHGLTVDGIAGPLTNGALDSAIASLGGSAPVVHRPPLNTAPVTMSAVQIQHALNLLGMTDDSGKPLVEDGNIGPKSTQAVMTFQRQHGGLVVDGKPGPLTQAALAEELAAAAPSQSASGTRAGYLGGNPWRYVA